MRLGEIISLCDRSDDPVVLAGQVKRALEAEARRWEKVSEEARAETTVLMREVGEVPKSEEAIWLRAVHQPDVLRAEAERDVAEALAKVRELEARQEVAAKQAEQIAAAKKRLAELEGGDLVTADRIDGEIAELDEKIRKLEQALAAARERRSQLVRRRQEAARLQQQIAELRKIVSQHIVLVSDAEIETAKANLETARGNLDVIVQLIRKAALSQRLEASRQRAAEANNKAEVYRDAAHATDEVLSGLVAKVTKRLRVEAGRLVCDTERGTEPFGELSLGERWRIALEIAVEQLGRGGLVTVPQEAWEALDPINRKEIAALAHDLGVVILTAEADEHDDIHVEGV